MPGNRQLAAILFTDIEGYTSMMQDDEQKAIAMKDRHREVLQKEHQSFNGRIVQYMGDGTLSIFQSAIDAVSCAISMQQAFQRWPQVPVRMGLHAGDIVIHDEDIFGDGVNLASRVESLSVPGCILISDRVKEEIANQPDFKTISVGSYQFKNINREVEVFALSADKLVVPEPNTLKGKTEEKKSAVPEKKKVELLNKSIAVFPFRNISSDADIEWLSDGFTEELTSAIACISELIVKSSLAMRQYKHTTKSFEEIAGELNTANFIEGTIQKQGIDVLINAHLINPAGEILNPFRFKKDFSEINFIYSQIAREVAESLNAILHLSEKKRLQDKSVVHPEVYQLYLQGRFAAQKLEPGEIEKAIGLFSSAIELDPEYAPALSGLAYCYIGLGYLNLISPDDAFEKSFPLLEKALELDSTLAYTHATRGWALLWFKRDFKAAEQEFVRANELDPSDANCIQGISVLHLYYGNSRKAGYWIEKGISIAPNDFLLNLFHGLWLFLHEDISEALDYMKAYNARHEHIFYCVRIGWIYTLTGNYQKAIDIFEHALEKFKTRRPALLAFLAAAYDKKGDLEKSKALFDELEQRISERKPNHAFYTATAYAFIGQTEKAMECLHKAYNLHDIDLLWIRTEPMLDKLKGTGEYEALLKEIGF